MRDSKIKPRHLIWATIALILTALLVWGLMPAPLRVETTKVTVEPLQVTLEEEGRARVRDRFVLSAPISGYLLFYGWTQIQSDPLYIFRVWEGGMSFHGGFFGVILATFVYARRHGLGLDRLLDLGAAALRSG